MFGQLGGGGGDPEGMGFFRSLKGTKAVAQPGEEITVECGFIPESLWVIFGINGFSYEFILAWSVLTGGPEINVGYWYYGLKPTITGTNIKFVPVTPDSWGPGEGVVYVITGRLVQ